MTLTSYICLRAIACGIGIVLVKKLASHVSSMRSSKKMKLLFLLFVVNSHGNGFQKPSRKELEECHFKELLKAPVCAVCRCLSGPHCLCPSPESGVQHGWAECCAAYFHYAPAAPAFH